MYAAAGGASLASRQARQRQRQQKKTQQLQAKLHPPKAPGLVVVDPGASTPTRTTSRQFHQLPTNYLRAPQSQGRKLSASYTGQSKLQLLPIDEGDTQSVMHMRMHSHAHMQQGAVAASAAQHSHQHHPQGTYAPYHTGAYHYIPHGHGRVSPKLVHRHSGSSGTSFHHSHLPKSATATLPLVSQVEATPPTTPSAAAVGVKASAAGSIEPVLMDAAADDEQQSSRIQIQIPHDSIIVTPATPMASPGHVAKQQHDELNDAAAETQPLTAATYDDDEVMQPPTSPLERKCSVYRMRRSNAFEQDGASAELTAATGVVSGFLAKKQLKDLQFQQQQYEPLILDEPMVFKGLPNGHKWQPCAYCEEGICVCEHIECAQGRAAWLERGRRCSVQESSQQAGAAAHRRWVKRNRIQDASLGGSSDDEDFLGVLRGPSTFANAFLYVGLGTVALGLVIAFVGTGEKGFKTVELRLIGPSLIGLGLICCILRILFCICPSHCIASNKKTRKKNGNKVDADHTTSLLRGENKRVSIARGPSMQKYPITHKRSNSKMLNEGMEALRQIATTSLFMQNEQKPSTNRVVPIIKEPGNASEAPLEMTKLETALNVCEISDEESEDPNDFHPATESQTNAAVGITRTAIVNEKPPLLRSGSKLSRQRVALNQQPSSPPAQQPQKSQSLSSSSTVKDSIDGDLLMETSLMVISPKTAANQNVARPPPLASGATSRLNKTSSPSTSTAPTTSSVGAHTGAIPRVTSAPLSYDLPPSTPHCYATPPTSTSMSTSRSLASTLLSSSITTERETRVRGPLGMPLSALTATSNRYTIPSSNISVPTTTTVSLLPLPAPPLLTTASPNLQAAPCIPGQVMQSDGNGGVNTTSLIILLPTTTTNTTTMPSTLTTSRNMPSSTALAVTAVTAAPTPSMSSLASSSFFKFPAPLSSSSASSSASSNGRTTATAAISGIASLAPPPTPAVSKFEPELVLSPAKLGQ